MSEMGHERPSAPQKNSEAFRQSERRECRSQTPDAEACYRSQLSGAPDSNGGSDGGQHRKAEIHCCAWRRGNWLAA